jgi:molybdenum-dependent DNA-binding transcriptional regulator ModE
MISLLAERDIPQERDMSHRAAWGRVKASGERLGMKLVIAEPGRTGMPLTEEAKN